MAIELKIPKPIIIIVQAFFLALGRFSGLNSYSNSAIPGTDGQLSFGRDLEGLPIAAVDNRVATLPIVPNRLILARKIRVTADWTTKQRDYLRKHISGGGGVKFGPFKFGGKGGSTSVTDDKTGSFDDLAITSEGIQVIGCISAILDRLPNPSTDLEWPTE